MTGSVGVSLSVYRTGYVAARHVWRLLEVSRTPAVDGYTVCFSANTHGLHGFMGDQVMLRGRHQELLSCSELLEEAITS